jgi:hypothetical protein
MNGILSYNNVLKGVGCYCKFKECKQEPGISERYILRQGVMPELVEGCPQNILVIRKTALAEFFSLLLFMRERYFCIGVNPWSELAKRKGAQKYPYLGGSGGILKFFSTLRVFLPLIVVVVFFLFNTVNTVIGAERKNYVTCWNNEGYRTK